MKEERLTAPFQEAINAKCTETELESADRVLALAAHNASNNRLPQELVKKIEDARQLIYEAKHAAHEIAYSNASDFRRRAQVICE